MDSKNKREKISTDAQIKASVKYNQSRDNIMIRPTKEDGQIIRAAAKAAGQSVQAYVLQAVMCRINLERTAPCSGISAGDLDGD